jgi:general secretion pathway protein L
MASDFSNSRSNSLRLPDALRRFLRWWRAELLALAPGWLRTPAPDLRAYAQFLWRPGDTSGAPAALRLLRRSESPDDNSPWLALEGESASQRDAVLAALAPEPGARQVGRSPTPEAVLFVPAERVLRRRLSLPLAAEDALRQVLELQIEHVTPFLPGQVYFGYRVLVRDFERGLIDVDFCATPRAGVDEAIKALSTWGVVVRGLLVCGSENDGVPPLNLLPDAEPRLQPIWRRGAVPWLAALVLLLGLAALALPIVIKREASIALSPWIEKARLAAEATDALRRELETRLEVYNFALAKKQQRPPVLVSLEELTRILPDDTWVTQVDIKGSEGQIQGETGSSSRLIGLFEQSLLFGNASFRSPLTKGAAPGTERYFLGFDIKPPAGSASGPVGVAASAAIPSARGASAPASPAPSASAAQAAQTSAVSSATPVVPASAVVQTPMPTVAASAPSGTVPPAGTTKP